MQRFFDILFSALALISLSPLLVPIAILLRFTGEGEIFFFQERVGCNGTIFKLYKFATMLKNSPNMATGTITVKNDSRVLPVGAMLRKTKINELPQLLNIFFGDMSLVGPRPLTLQTFDSYSLQIQRIIQLVRPGLSGIGSIIFRSEEDVLADISNPVDFYNQEIAPYKGLLEEWYIKNQTNKTYFAIIFITVWVIIFSKSNLVWRIFPGLPIPPTSLRQKLNYSC